MQKTLGKLQIAKEGLTAVSDPFKLYPSTVWLTCCRDADEVQFATLHPKDFRPDQAEH